MARLYNGAERPNRCVYCYNGGERHLSFVIRHSSFAPHLPQHPSGYNSNTAATN
ncbi:hypothetical protein [Coleofasciculus chthonoplastes]|uniref:hypothetical protein n=1 Tax=Coleofasciculus chthonoplastes TaxID=64178 RepID=UPI0012FB1B64|nr:hypothetical protein [Coleofasciculus chthonoplastes]